MLTDTDSGMVSNASVRLKNKRLLRNEVYGDFEKKSLKPLENGVRSKWKAYDWNYYGWKPFIGKSHSTSLNSKDNRFFESVAVICLTFFFRPSRLPEHHREMLNGPFKRYFSNIRAFYKFCHLQVQVHQMQVPNDTKNNNFGAMSQVEKLGLLG